MQNLLYTWCKCVITVIFLNIVNIIQKLRSVYQINDVFLDLTLIQTINRGIIYTENICPHKLDLDIISSNFYCNVYIHRLPRWLFIITTVTLMELAIRFVNLNQLRLLLILRLTIDRYFLNFVPSLISCFKTWL